MTTLYLIRHAESVANASNLLAGQKDFPLSPQGKTDANTLAANFSAHYQIDAIWCSPLLRAQQTAAPFVSACDVGLRFDARIIEQHMGRFSGMSYAQAEADPGYCQDRGARWNWEPEGEGESYKMIAERVHAFLGFLRGLPESTANVRFLIVTHAVTLRLFRACLEGTLPHYPEKIAGNGEMWTAELSADGGPVVVDSVELGVGSRSHRA